MMTLLVIIVVSSPLWFYPLAWWATEVERWGSRSAWERRLASVALLALRVGIGGTLLWVTLWVTLSS